MRERLVDSRGDEKASCVGLPEIQAVFGPGWRPSGSKHWSTSKHCSSFWSLANSCAPSPFQAWNDHQTQDRHPLLPPACRKRPVI